MQFKPGDKLCDGKYEIERQLTGEDYSGFGITYKAKDVFLDTTVVLKLPNSTLLNDPRYKTFLKNFDREAKLLAQLKQKELHPNIVQINNLFPIHISQESIPVWCIDMQYIKGEDLSQKVCKDNKLQPLAESEAIIYIRAIGSALSYLHNHKPDPILHRDVKPENIMIRENDDRAILIDFGIARTFIPEQKKAHTSLCSPGYSPPEQYNYDEIQRGAYIDIYSLSATLYFLLTAQRPPEIDQNTLGRGKLYPPRYYEESISQTTNDAILWGMELDYNDRPQTVEKWLDALPEEIDSTPVNESPEPERKTHITILARSPDPTIPVGKPFWEPLKRFFNSASNLDKSSRDLPSNTINIPIKNNIFLELVFISGGNFQMGQSETESQQLKTEVGEDIYNQCFLHELPYHSVQVPDFWISKFPITQAQYKAIMNENPAKICGKEFVGSDYPALAVSWQMAKNFCDTLSNENYNFRLPTEAEWEYACRANTNSPFYFGNHLSSDYANFNQASKQRKRHSLPTPVNTFPENAWGVKDMHGNVWEWCADEFYESYTNKPDQLKQDASIAWTVSQGRHRVLRGGSWETEANFCRCAYRTGDNDNEQKYDYGFRVVALLG